MAGKRPDYNVKVAVPYQQNGETKHRYFLVGAGWDNTGGGINFNICTLPGVTLWLFPADDDKAKAGDDIPF